MNWTPRAGTPLRVVVGWLVLFALASGSVRAGEPPTLGGLLSSPTVGTDSTVTVENRSTVTAVVDLLTTDPAYVLSPVTLTLEPGERTAVDIVATGTDPASIVATFTPADPPPGITGAAVLEAPFRHPSPWERMPWAVLVLVMLLAAVGAAGVRRLRRAG